MAKCSLLCLSKYVNFSWCLMAFYHSERNHDVTNSIDVLPEMGNGRLFTIGGLCDFKLWLISLNWNFPKLHQYLNLLAVDERCQTLLTVTLLLMVQPLTLLRATFPQTRMPAHDLIIIYSQCLKHFTGRKKDTRTLKLRFTYKKYCQISISGCVGVRNFKMMTSDFIITHSFVCNFWL